MPRPARDLLARLLSGASAAADSASIRLPADALALTVDGIGRVTTPIRAPHARQLIEAARPAQYGHGEQTLSDRSVRDTWEIEPSRVRLGGPA